MRRYILCALVLLSLATQPALAMGRKTMPVKPSPTWHEVGKVSVNGNGVQELSVQGPVTSIRITSLDGDVVIDFIDVRKQNGLKDLIQVRQAIPMGTSREWAIGNALPVAGMTVSHDGKGSYSVEVK